MVERFNGRISEVLHQTRFGSAEQLETTLMRYMNTYNHQIPQRALKHVSPIQALKDWYVKNAGFVQEAWADSNPKCNTRGFNE